MHIFPRLGGLAPLVQLTAITDKAPRHENSFTHIDGHVIWLTIFLSDSTLQVNVVRVYSLTLRAHIIAGSVRNSASGENTVQATVITIERIK